MAEQQQAEPHTVKESVTGVAEDTWHVTDDATSRSRKRKGATSTVAQPQRLGDEVGQPPKRRPGRPRKNATKTVPASAAGSARRCVCQGLFSKDKIDAITM